MGVPFWLSLRRFGVKKQLFFIFAFTSTAILLAVLAVVRDYASVEIVSFALMATFASVAGLLLWWNSKRNLGGRTQGSDKTSSALIWLLVPFTASAVVAVIQAMHEKWDIGDTIGLAFFMMFAALSIYEILRRRRTKDSR
jgi:hypothetical protein